MISTRFRLHIHPKISVSYTQCKFDSDYGCKEFKIKRVATESSEIVEMKKILLRRLSGFLKNPKSMKNEWFAATKTTFNHLTNQWKITESFLVKTMKNKQNWRTRNQFSEWIIIRYNFDEKVSIKRTFHLSTPIQLCWFIEIICL